MDYVRDHIKRYWGMAYRRTIGIAITTFAMVMAIGMAFTVLTKSLALTGPLSYVAFWLVITAGGIIVMLANFLGTHTSSVWYMTDEEHTIHARFMAWWMVSIVVGVALFFLPALFSGAEFLPLILLGLSPANWLSTQGGLPSAHPGFRYEGHLVHHASELHYRIARCIYQHSNAHEPGYCHY